MSLRRARDHAFGKTVALSLLALACGQVSRDPLDEGAGGDTTGAGGGTAGVGATTTAGGMALAGRGGGGAVGGGGVVGGGAIAGAGIGVGGGIGDLCPANRDCIAKIPKGWQGPIAAHDTSLGGEVPLCDGAFSRKEAPMYGGLDGGEHSCSCRCSLPEGLACGQATLQLFEGDSCSDEATASMSLWPNGYGSCFTTMKPGPAAAYGAVRLSAVAPLDSSSTCAPHRSSTIDEPSWNETLTACLSNVPPQACGPETLCVAARPPAAFNLGLCIYQEGDSRCPSGYERRMLRYRSFIDERGCSACTCGPPEGECKPHIALTADGDVCQEDAALEGVGECLRFALEESTPAIRYRYVGEPMRGDSCPASTSKAVGALQAIAPVTVCCNALR